MVKCSIIIPTYNRADVLKRCLFSLSENKEINQAEIILVDDGSNSENIKKIKKIINSIKLNIKIFYQKNAGPAAARNLAIKKSLGKILMFINDDTVVENDFINKHMEFHKKFSKENRAVLGLFIDHPEIKHDQIVDKFLYKSKMHFDYPSPNGNKYELLPWNYFWTNNISLKKSFLIKNKLNFDTDFATAAWEDVEFGWRAKNKGLHIYLDRNLVAYHYHRLGFDDLISRFFSHGRGLFVLSRKIDYDALPPLAKRRYRILARILLFLTMSRHLEPIIRKYFKNGGENVFLMHWLVIYQKITGFDYQSNYSL